MTHAWYGRMKVGECVKRDYGYLGCAENQLQAVDKRCSGHQECSVSIPDHEMTAAIPCIQDLSPYLEAQYLCQAGNLLYFGQIAQSIIRRLFLFFPQKEMHFNSTLIPYFYVIL